MRARFLPLAAVLLVAACDETTGPNISGLDPIAISRIELTPSLDTIVVQEPFTAEHSVRLFGTVVMRNGLERHDVVLAWRSSDPAVAIVDETGLVRAVGYGTTIITASAGKAATAEIVVVPAPVVEEPPPEEPPSLATEPPPYGSSARP